MKGAADRVEAVAAVIDAWSRAARRGWRLVKNVGRKADLSMADLACLEAAAEGLAFACQQRRAEMRVTDGTR